MAGPGASYPKPASRHANPVLGWTLLAPRPRVRTPKLPAREHGWHPETVAWWRELWKSPQAAMWDPSGRTLHAAARLYDLSVRAGTSAALEGELRQHYDRHGLSPKAMLQLRWRLADPGDLDDVAAGHPPATPTVSSMSAAQRRRLLRSLNDPA